MASVHAAIEIITSSDLSPTEHLILRHFVEEAISPITAAEYLLSRIQQTHQSVEGSLRDHKLGWRKLTSRLTVHDTIPHETEKAVIQRDGDGFTLRRSPRNVPASKAEATYIIPPSFTRQLKLHDQSLLKAFLSNEDVDRLSNLLETSEEDTPARLRNALLLTPSIRAAFRDGHVNIKHRLRRSDKAVAVDEDDYPKRCTYGLYRLFPEQEPGLCFGDGTPFCNSLEFFVLDTPDAKQLCLPSNFLLDVHSKFAAALHLFSIEDKAARGCPSKPLGLQLPVFATRSLSAIWLSLPQRVRVSVYLLLGRLGRKLYPLEAGVWAQRLPFGLYMKQCTRAPTNEPNVLKLLQQQTTIPAPRLVDEFERKGVTTIIMTRLPGVPVQRVCHLMSYPERDRFAADMRNCVEQLHRIKNTTPYLICDSLGGPATDHRIPSDKGGPFSSEADFNNHLTSHLDASFAVVVEFKGVSPCEHSFFPFTHGDLHPSNVLVERGRLSGIVDWESAGFRPEYWEFTKAMYTLGTGTAMPDIYRRVFGSKYEPQLEVERQLWSLTPFGV